MDGGTWTKGSKGKREKKKEMQKVIRGSRVTKQKQRRNSGFSSVGTTRTQDALYDQVGLRDSNCSRWHPARMSDQKSAGGRLSGTVCPCAEAARM